MGESRRGPCGSVTGGQPPAHSSFGVEGETEARRQSTRAARCCCQRDRQQLAVPSPTHPKNRSGLLSVTIPKQLRLPGDRQRAGSRMVPRQDPAQGHWWGTGPFPSPSTLL